MQKLLVLLQSVQCSPCHTSCTGLSSANCWLISLHARSAALKHHRVHTISANNHVALQSTRRVLQTTAVAAVSLLAATVADQHVPLRSRPLAGLREGQQGAVNHALPKFDAGSHLLPCNWSMR